MSGEIPKLSDARTTQIQNPSDVLPKRIIIDWHKEAAKLALKDKIKQNKSKNDLDNSSERTSQKVDSFWKDIPEEYYIGKISAEYKPTVVEKMIPLPTDSQGNVRIPADEEVYTSSDTTTSISQQNDEQNVQTVNKATKSVFSSCWDKQ